MAAFENPDHEGRLVIIPQVPDAFADLHFGQEPCGSFSTVIQTPEGEEGCFQVNDTLGDAVARSVFNLPFLFHRSGEPWVEANSYIMSLVRDKPAQTRPTDDARRQASRLVDYLIFCEKNNIDWLDFSAKRLPQRPTYKYHRNLMDMPERGAQVANQYTGSVYRFYKFVSRNWQNIDMARVDSVKQIKLFVENSYGMSKQITVERRSQTQPYSRKKSVPLGFVDDEGECLRPLGNSELADLVDVVNSDAWSAQERLIMLFAVMTGARKQTVLTLRAKHIQKLMDSKLQPDGTYILKAGPGTGIDTKNSKEQILYVPKQLAIDLLTYVSSPHARKRRQGFQSAYAASFEGLDPIPEDDMYVFISEQCNCYYMAKSDPRYRYVKSRPLGAVTNNLKAKLLKSVSADFSKDFTYHWLRATFAFQLYQLLVPRLKDGSLQPGDEIAIIQSRLHHERRETTENYLKLFTMIPEKVRAQESYEGALFKFSSYSDMIMGKAQCSKG